MLAFWLSGHLIGEFYPFSPLGMFDAATTTASRLFVRDANGEDKEIGFYDAWTCDGPIDFKAPPSCPEAPYSAYDEIVRDHIQSHAADASTSTYRETLQITRRIFHIPEPGGPLEIEDCPLVQCNARRRTGFWIPRL